MKIRKIPLLLLPLLLCGCSGTQLLSKPKPDFDKTYEISAEIDYGKYSATADITRNGSGDWNFSFSEPEYLMGVEFKLSEDGMTASLGDISVKAEENSMYTMIPDTIASVLDALPSLTAESITDNEGILTMNTDISGDKAVVTADTSGNLLTLKCPSQRLSVKFSGQQEIAVTQTSETFEFIIE